MTPASQHSNNASVRRSKGSSQRAAAGGERSRGSSRASLLMRLLITLVVFGACGAVAWWAFRPVPAAQETMTAETSAQSTTLPLFDRVAVSGRVGATPTIEIKAPLEVDGTKAATVIAGNGRQITEGSPVLVAITAFDGKTGTNLSDSGRPQLSLGIVGTNVIGDDLTNIVIGQNEGSRILAYRTIAPGAGAPGSTSNIEVEVIDILPSIAVGTEADASNGPLTVNIVPEGPIITHGTTVPDRVTTQTLIKGDGIQVHESDRVVAQFTAVGWNDGVVRVSTWETGVPQVINLGKAMRGLQTALVDQKVGSRLAITIPPDLAAGDDTLCFVIDILGTEPGLSATGDTTPQS